MQASSHELIFSGAALPTVQSLIDLAGSEKMADDLERRKEGGVLTRALLCPRLLFALLSFPGFCLNEMLRSLAVGYINRSLLTLGNIIHKLSEGKKGYV